MLTQSSLSDRQKRLIFRSWHRGTKEMDLLLGSFADAHIPAMGEAELDLYEALLGENDPDLYNWYSRREPTPARLHNSVMDMFLGHNFV